MIEEYLKGPMIVLDFISDASSMMVLGIFILLPGIPQS